jgi:hypothetical protein
MCMFLVKIAVYTRRLNRKEREEEVREEEKEKGKERKR